MYTQFEAAEFKNGNMNKYFYLQLVDMLELVKKWSEERDVASSEAIDELISYLGKEKYIKRKQDWARVVRNPVEYEWLGQIYQLDQELSKKANDDAQRLGEKLIQLKNWYEEKQDKRAIWLALVKMSRSYLGAVIDEFGKEEEAVRTKAAEYFYYDDNRNIREKDAAYHKNKEEKEEKEWLSRIQRNARSEDSILRAIFDKVAGDKNTTAGGAAAVNTIRKGEMAAYLVKKCNIRSDEAAKRTLKKISEAMFKNAKPITFNSLTRHQFLNIMRGARRVIEDNNAKGSDSRKNPADTPWWYDFYEAFVMDKVQSKEILETFKAHDRNQSGLIELSELREDYEINKQIGGEAIKSMDRYDTDGDGKLDLKEFRYWHWDTNTLDQPSPEEIQERDRLVMLIKNLKDAFSTFTNDIEPELEDYPLAPAESKFMSAEPQIKDREPGSKKNPFTNKKNALAKCIKQIEDEGNSALDGDEAVVNFGFVYVLRQKYWIIYINNLASKLKNLPHGLQSRFNILTYGEIEEYCQPYGSSGSTSGNSSEARSGQTIWKFLVESGLEENPPESEIFGPTFDDEGPATPLQSPKRISIDTRDVIIEDSTAKRNKENIFKILMEKNKQATARLQQIESLKAEYSRLKDIAKEFIQGAEEDLA